MKGLRRPAGLDYAPSYLARRAGALARQNREHFHETELFMSQSQRLLVYAGSMALLCTGLGVWAGSVNARALSTSAPAAPDSAKTAVFDVLDISEKLFQGDRYAPAREKALKEKEAQRDALQAGLTELQQKIIAAGQETPEGKLMIPTYQGKAQELQQFMQAADVDLNRLSTAQFNECYRLAVETAQSLAKQQGYTHLLASKMGSLEFRSKELQQALQEVLARPVLLTAEGDDLTAQVKKELKITDEPPAGDKGADDKKGADKGDPTRR